MPPKASSSTTPSAEPTTRGRPRSSLERRKEQKYEVKFSTDGKQGGKYGSGHNSRGPVWKEEKKKGKKNPPLLRRLRFARALARKPYRPTSNLAHWKMRAHASVHVCQSARAHRLSRYMHAHMFVLLTPRKCPFHHHHHNRRSPAHLRQKKATHQKSFFCANLTPPLPPSPPSLCPQKRWGGGVERGGEFFLIFAPC